MTISVARRLARRLGDNKRRLEGSVLTEYSIEVSADNDANALSDSLAAMEPDELAQSINANLLAANSTNAVTEVLDIFAPEIEEHRSPVITAPAAAAAAAATPQNQSHDITALTPKRSGSRVSSSLSIFTFLMLAAALSAA